MIIKSRDYKELFELLLEGIKFWRRQALLLGTMCAIIFVSGYVILGSFVFALFLYYALSALRLERQAQQVWKIYLH